MRATCCALAMSGLLILTVAGCGADGPQPPDPVVIDGCRIGTGPITIAVGGRANSPAPTLPDQIETVVHDIVYATPANTASPPITVIDVDGAPKVLADQAFRSHSGNDPALETQRAAFVNDVVNAVAQVRAATAEVDDLGALSYAEDGLHSAGGGTLVLIDSGLQTMAPLDFRQPGMLDADPNEVVTQLNAAHEIPDFTHLTVVLVNLGYTAPPQTRLDPGRQQNLVNLYKAIAHAGHATCVAKLDAPGTSAAPSPVPPVSQVPVPPTPPIDPLSGTFTLPDNSTVGFIPNEATFINPQAANQLLLPLAQWFTTHPSAHITITGTTARWGSHDYQINLARNRANTVAQNLIQNGVDPSQISTTSLGSYFPGYVNDHASDGTLIANLAQLNRTVILTW